MENKHVIHGLRRERADVAAQIAVIHDQLRDLQADLAHVESTLRMFKPDIDFARARVSRKPGKQSALYGEISRAVRDALRGVEEPQTFRNIAAKVMATRGLDAEDEELMKAVRKRVGASLRNLKTRGHAESRHGLELAMVWRRNDQPNVVSSP